MGGDLKDDLIFVGWEPSVLSIEMGAGTPTLTALRPGVWCGRALEAGERVTLTDGERIAYRDEALTVREELANAGGETRPSSERTKAAVRVVLEFLPRGGKLTVEIAGRVYTTELSDRRCDLVACLLKPPAPFRSESSSPKISSARASGLARRTAARSSTPCSTGCARRSPRRASTPAPLFERRGGLRFCLAPDASVVVG